LSFLIHFWTLLKPPRDQHVQKMKCNFSSIQTYSILFDQLEKNYNKIQTQLELTRESVDKRKFFPLLLLSRHDATWKDVVVERKIMQLEENVHIFSSLSAFPICITVAKVIEDSFTKTLLVYTVSFINEERRECLVWRKKTT
jgi:hypothetical protein